MSGSLITTISAYRRLRQIASLLHSEDVPLAAIRRINLELEHPPLARLAYLSEYWILRALSEEVLSPSFDVSEAVAACRRCAVSRRMSRRKTRRYADLRFRLLYRFSQPTSAPELSQAQRLRYMAAARHASTLVSV